MRTVPYPHPGEILLEEFLTPMDITRYRLAKAIGVQQTRVDEIVSGKRAITADSALRLSKFFGLPDDFWFALQAQYDAAVMRDEIGPQLQAIEPWQRPDSR